MDFLFFFNFERNYYVLKLKSSCILLNKNINFNKNKTNSKVENLTQSFRETNLVVQLIYESQIKSKTVMSWSSRKKKEDIFCTVYFLRRKYFYNICILSQCIVYLIHFQNIHIFTNQKTFLHTLFCLFLKLSKALSVSSNGSGIGT